MVTSTELSTWVEKMKSEAVANQDRPESGRMDPENLMHGIKVTFGEVTVKELVYNELFPYFCHRSETVLSKLN